MTDAGFYRGTNAEQDSRFSDKNKKLMKQMKFSDCLDKKVDISKINLEVIKPWITQRLCELLNFEDDVVIEFVINQLMEKTVDPKLMQINLTGFLNAKNARIFMGDLWQLILSAQDNIGGIPEMFIQQKKEQILKKYEENATNQALEIPEPSSTRASDARKQSGKVHTDHHHHRSSRHRINKDHRRHDSHSRKHELEHKRKKRHHSRRHHHSRRSVDRHTSSVSGDSRHSSREKLNVSHQYRENESNYQNNYQRDKRAYDHHPNDDAGPKKIKTLRDDSLEENQNPVVESAPQVLSETLEDPSEEHLRIKALNSLNHHKHHVSNNALAAKSKSANNSVSELSSSLSSSGTSDSEDTNSSLSSD